MREATIALMAAAAVFSALACGSGSEPSAPAAPTTPPAAGAPPAPSAPGEAPSPPAGDKVALAVLIAREVADDPDHASEILGRHGMTEQQYESLMLDIAADPDLSRRYTKEMER